MSDVEDDAYLSSGSSQGFDDDDESMGRPLSDFNLVSSFLAFPSHNYASVYLFILCPADLLSALLSPSPKPRLTKASIPYRGLQR